MGFGESVGDSTKRLLLQTNNKAVEISQTLFTATVVKTPIEKGELVNNWWTGVGVDVVNKSYTASRSRTGSNSYGQINALKESKEFEGKDGEVSFTNTTPYAYRAEYFGWNFSKKEPRWRGTKPYAMMRNALTETVAKYKDSK